MTMFYCVPRKRCPQLSLGSEGKLVFDGELEIDCADIWHLPVRASTLEIDKNPVEVAQTFQRTAS
jgi:hypothetical protein